MKWFIAVAWFYIQSKNFKICTNREWKKKLYSEEPICQSKNLNPTKNESVIKY